MRRFNASELKTFENLTSLTQKELHKVMTKYLHSKYKKVVSAKKYIYAIGDIPIALVSHMDTVFPDPPSEIFYDAHKNVVWGDGGLGADDRAGIFAIIKLIEKGYRPSVILTTDEEVGGVGASALARKKCPFPGLKYMIELDRQGSNDCVFYQQYNPLFVDYIEDFGFVEAWGTYTDICELTSAWNICGVNLSIGYIDEHSLSERLYVGSFFKTIERVETMLNQKEIPHFEYKEMSYGQIYKSFYGDLFNDDFSCIRCNSCKNEFPEYDVFPIKGLNGKTLHYCCDCVVDGDIDWCNNCGEAFESDGTDGHICLDCRRAMGEDYKNV